MKIAVLDDYPGVALSLADWSSLEAQVTVFRDSLSDIGEMQERLLEFDVICHLAGGTSLIRDLISGLPNLRLIVTSDTTGLEVEREAAWEKGITICWVDSPETSQAEQTLAMLLSLTRRIEAEARAMRQGTWQTGVGTQLSGLEFGLIGFDHSGETIAHVARALGMTVSCWSATWSALELSACGVQPYQNMHEVFAGADVVSLHLPAEEVEAQMITETEFKLMRPGSIFLNTNSGEAVDWRGLLESMDQGRPQLAALDVFDEEPLSPQHPLRQSTLVEEGRLLLTPNMGSFARESLELSYSQMVDCIGAWHAGIPIRIMRPEK